MKVSIIGTGYVGLVSGTCLSEVGNQVICVDTDTVKIDKLNNGNIPIYEPGLDTMVKENVATGRLSFTNDIKQAVDHGEVLFIAVGTPPDEDGSADLQYVLSVASDIGRCMDSFKVVVTKSTVPVGTAAKVKKKIEDELALRKADLDFAVVSNPEFLKEGAAIEDFMKPDRIVVGVEHDQAEQVMRQLYAPFNRSHERVIVMDVPSAELTKYAANSMLATKISFMNDLANLAEILGADIEKVRQGIGSDPRIGYDFIYPGCGYGGSCFPKDVQALVRTAAENGHNARILEAVEAVNNDQKQVLLSKIEQEFGNDLNGRTFAIWGLAFKPETDDMREAPSRVIIEGLWNAGAKVQAFDPVAEAETSRIYGERDDLKMFSDPYAVLEGVDALILITEWKIFRSTDLGRMAELMKSKIIFDGRNVFDPESMKTEGFRYYGIGR